MKNIDFVIKKTAQELNLPESKVKSVVMAYWSELYYGVLTGSETTVTARHIGTFTVSRWKLNNYIHKLITKIRTVRKHPTLSEDIKQKMLEFAYKKLRNCLYHRNKISIQYAKQFKNI